MKRFILGLALLAGLAIVGSVSADGVGRAMIRTVADEQPKAKAAEPAKPAAPASNNCPHCGSGNTCAQSQGDARVGILPGIRDLFTKVTGSVRLCKKCGGTFDKNCPTPAFNPYPNGVPGTLVFPQHPFVRSPRDFFMWEPK